MLDVKVGKAMENELSKENEAEWIRRAQDGDGEAFEALFHAYYPMTFALVYNMVGRYHDAEEIVQEAFIKAAQALPRFRGASSIKTWLYRIAMNAVTDFRRRNQGNLALEPEPPDMISEAGPHPLQESVRQALDRLGASQRQAVVLTYFEGMNHSEAAEVLGCAEATISWRLFSARRKLKKILSRELARGEAI